MKTGKDKIQIIDDFLPQKEFQEIQSTIMEGWPFLDAQDTPHHEHIGWAYSTTVADKDEPKNWKYFYLVHVMYMQPTLLSPHIFEKIIPVLKKLNVKALIRIKANLFPNSEKIHEHEAHTDFSYSHYTALFSLNTCNGYTKFSDGTKVDSVADRILIFDGSLSHQSTTTSDTTARFNINFNYF